MWIQSKLWQYFNSLLQAAATNLPVTYSVIVSCFQQKNLAPALTLIALFPIIHMNKILFMRHYLLIRVTYPRVARHYYH